MPKQINNSVNLVDPATFVNGVIESIQKGRDEYAPGKNAIVLRMLNRFLPKGGLKLIDKLSRKQLLAN